MPRKGADFERDMCRLLSGYLSNGKRDDLLWRTAMSGGRATIGFRKGIVRSTQVGDIGAIHPMGEVLTDHFVIECKNRKGGNFLLWLLKGEGNVAKWWEKVCDEAATVKRYPLMICNVNRKGIIFAVAAAAHRAIVGPIRPLAMPPIRPLALPPAGTAVYQAMVYDVEHLGAVLDRCLPSRPGRSGVGREGPSRAIVRRPLPPE